MSQTLVIAGVQLLGRDSADIVIENGVIAEVGSIRSARGADVLEAVCHRRHVRERLVDVEDQHRRATSPARSHRLVDALTTAPGRSGDPDGHTSYHRLNQRGRDVGA